MPARLVDHALVAERTGLAGRAYVDIGGIHPDGDRWLESTAKQLAELGFDLDVDRDPTTLPVTARFDAPALYFGWYANDLNGPFALPSFQFPPGAIALHIHSYSARTVRSATEAWCGPLVARGVTATVGNVFEPYLQLTHDPSLLLRALARGMTFGEAATYAIPALSWQGVAIGDPLYRPFAVPLATQLSDLRASCRLRSCRLCNPAAGRTCWTPTENRTRPWRCFDARLANIRVSHCRWRWPPGWRRREIWPEPCSHSRMPDWSRRFIPMNGHLRTRRRSA